MSLEGLEGCSVVDFPISGLTSGVDDGKWTGVETAGVV